MPGLNPVESNEFQKREHMSIECEKYEDEIFGSKKLVWSTEVKQDLAVMSKLLFANRTGKLKSEQITEWQESYEALSNLNIDEARNKVKFIDLESPYQYME
jgi:hypothetical protein